MGIGIHFTPRPRGGAPRTALPFKPAWGGPLVVPPPSAEPAPPPQPQPVQPVAEPAPQWQWRAPEVGQPGQVELTPAASAASDQSTVSVTLDRLALLPRYVAPGRLVREVTFVQGGRRYVATPAGELRTAIDPASGNGQPVGQVEIGTGQVWLHHWDAGSNQQLSYWSALQARPLSGPDEMPAEAMMIFRTAAAPLRPSSLQIVATMQDGTPVSVTADADGRIVHERVLGTIDYQSGVGTLVFRSPTPTGYGELDLSHWQFPGVSTVHVDAVLSSTLRYNAVAYEAIPVDPAVIGVDPVRLPSDGRVPIFNRGDYVVVHNTQALAPRTLADQEVVDVGRTRLSRILLTGADGKAITAGWQHDLDAGTLTALDTASWQQPVTIEHTIEHMARVREVDVGGAITLTLPLPHHYPIEGSYVSSALMLGERFARVSHLWDQQTWTDTAWADHLMGNQATGNYNDTAAPVEVDNRGCITERWALHFTSATHFRVVGEHVGVVATGNINEDCAPINPITSTPYFTLRALGWGIGWAAGNVLRINTVGAGAGMACIRAVQPGPASAIDHRFALLLRVDVDRPGD
ncbi:hypothetical protein EBQ34_01300 [Vandammella animalimorsus]|uniref:Uncharacterized protein n=1 Tax=Vandammella animalimorsus TaxID=2029117 RepID=A0A3M6RU53_9BURK|nr:hypothetical protein [Vandammella animalimorsus]RMX19019.1 hypothetical protein EBQ34_01300 [Vandammella animalimorsus]